MRKVLLGIAGAVIGGAGGFFAGAGALAVILDQNKALSSDGSAEVVLAVIIVGCFVLTGAALGAFGGGVCSDWHSRYGLLLGTAVGLVGGLGLMTLTRQWAYRASSGAGVWKRLLALALACLVWVVVCAIAGRAAYRPRS